MTEQPRDFGGYFQSMLQSARQAAAANGTDIEAMRARSEEISQQLAALRERTFNGLPDEEDDDSGERHTDRTATVIAEVDGRGRLLTVDISPFAMRDLETDELTAAIVEAIKLARTQASEQMREVFAELTPKLTDMPEAPPVSHADVAEVLAEAKEVAARWSDQQLKR